MEQHSSDLAGSADTSPEMVQKEGQQVCSHQNAFDCRHGSCLGSQRPVCATSCSVRHLSINVKSWEKTRKVTEEDEAIMDPLVYTSRRSTREDTMLQDTMLQRFLFEVVGSASNLQTLSLSLNGVLKRTWPAQQWWSDIAVSWR